MRNFDKKVKYLNSLFIYKFRVYDYENKKLKIYYISPDKSHIYLSIDLVPNLDKVYFCEVGELYFDEKRKNTFEDTPTEIFHIDRSDYTLFRKYYDKLPSWVNHKITEIMDSYDNKEGIDLVF
jgi:hypothetical protein